MPFESMVTPFINRNDVAAAIAREMSLDAERQIAAGAPDSHVNFVLWRLADELGLHDDVDVILQDTFQAEVLEARFDGARARWGHD